MSHSTGEVECAGDRKKGGCHDVFEDAQAYWAHIHRKTGGCTNPANYSNFYREDGVWKLKKLDDTLGR